MRAAVRLLPGILALLAAALVSLVSVAPGDARTSAGTMPEVSVADLPNEARQTLDLIARGGPYPHDRDGVAFGNRERLLPAKPRGYYREYTVRTPGVKNRGARRIVAGKGGELYYTDDHYDSFTFVVRS
ncbi:MAG TPA: ribonuclease domain-containing protein [Acidimicrobiales bacterium]